MNRGIGIARRKRGSAVMCQSISVCCSVAVVHKLNASSIEKNEKNTEALYICALKEKEEEGIKLYKSIHKPICT